jgi:hypothetical protein
LLLQRRRRCVTPRIAAALTATAAYLATATASTSSLTTAIATSVVVQGSRVTSVASAVAVVTPTVVAVRGEGCSCLNGVAAASFIIELVDDTVQCNRLVLAEISADIARLVGIGLLDR